MNITIIDMNTDQDGAKILDKSHYEGKCVKLFQSSSRTKTKLTYKISINIKYTVWELNNLGPTLERSHN